MEAGEAGEGEIKGGQDSGGARDREEREANVPRLQRDRHTRPLWATETSGLTTGCGPRMAGKEREGEGGRGGRTRI